MTTPERIWATSIRPKLGIGAFQTRQSDAHPCYVLASVADEDRRKLGVAREALRAVDKRMTHGPLDPSGITHRHVRAALAEIEGDTA